MSEQIEQPGQLEEETFDVQEQAVREQSVVIEKSYFRKPAGFWIRFWAYLIDIIIVGAISGLVVKPIFRVIDYPISDPIFLLYSPYKLIMLALFLAYFLLMTKYFGQTVGKMITGIRVIKKTGEPLGWKTLLFREVIGRYISKTLLIPYLLVIFMPRKEALHDLFADTEVVHEQVYEKANDVPAAPVNESRRLQGGQRI
ncbi:RDD family protein [Sporosarcina aquimarina]|uniref:RDD family protein n=1 Tax=Sporosarcina aquimarina TaxID=114975 RepID=A0ABU4G200_9BACL|nr:RDD family protein [Sporosarcina aquimarina]MDW0110348.1 RDD family protein [Sporosarcina aquimarina]